MANWNLDVQEATAAVSGKLNVVNADPLSLSFTGVGTDSRVDLSGSLFIALKGDKFDAHDHLEEAVSRGARGVLVHRTLDSELKARLAAKARSGLAVIEVADTLVALQQLGLYWRKKNRALILGITGTNGKTSTKEFLAAILSSRLKVHAAKGSFNNHWGVPMTLLGIQPDHDVAVIEMGMNHLGELKDLSRLVEANAVVCTMVGRGHLEGVGSVDGVASAKAEIYEFAPAQAAFVFNVDNPYTRQMMDHFSTGDRRIVLFSEQIDRVVLDGTERLIDVHLKVVEDTATSLRVVGRIGDAHGEAIIPVFGRHNVTNLMAASSMALLAGLHGDEIFRALPRCKAAWGRGEWRELESGARMLFDAYNANPESMRAALENISRLAKAQGVNNQTARTFAVLGDMRELGAHSESNHEEIGRIAAQCGFEAILYFGKEYSHFERGLRAGSSTPFVFRAEFDASVWAEFRSKLRKGDIVLVKASRGVGLERVLS